jgi:phosphatidylserine synthase 2
MNLIDLSYFFNKYVLWIEPNHVIMKYRVFGLGFLSIAAAREYYVYIVDE